MVHILGEFQRRQSSRGQQDHGLRPLHLPRHLRQGGIGGGMTATSGAGCAHRRMGDNGGGLGLGRTTPTCPNSSGRGVPSDEEALRRGDDRAPGRRRPAHAAPSALQGIACSLNENTEGLACSDASGG
jgi:hypothetical protein